MDRKERGEQQMDKYFITQLCGAGEDVVALDNRGRAWILDDDNHRWEALPELPQDDRREVKSEAGSS
jgi:hypothetical protein